MSELVDLAEHGNVAFPELAIGGTTSHGSEQEVVDLDDLAHLTGGDKRTLGGSSVDSDQDTLLELESESGRTLCEVSHLGCHLLQVSLEVHLILNGGHLEVEAFWVNLFCASLLSLLEWVLSSELLSTELWSKGVERCICEALGETEVLISRESKVHFHLD